MKKFIILQALIVGIILGACDSKSVENIKSSKSEEQRLFEAKARDISWYRIDAKGGSRESEEGYIKEMQFWNQVSAMRVENWRCKFFDSVAPWKSESHIIKNQYVLDCKDVDAKDSVEAFGRGKFMLWIPDQLHGIPNKIYDGDVIEWSGVVKRGSSFGLVKGFVVYELIVEVTKFGISAAGVK